MRLIELYINEATIMTTKLQQLISDSVNDVGVAMTFTPDWDGLTKVAVFACGKVSKSVVLPDDRPVPLPWDTLLTAGQAYRIGVYGYDGTVLVRQTVPVLIGYVQKGTDRAAGESSQFTPTIVQKLLEDISDLSKRIDALTEGSSGVAWVEL